MLRSFLNMWPARAPPPRSRKPGGPGPGGNHCGHPPSQTEEESHRQAHATRHSTANPAKGSALTLNDRKIGVSLCHLEAHEWSSGRLTYDLPLILGHYAELKGELLMIMPRQKTYISWDCLRETGVCGYLGLGDNCF